MTTAPLPTGDRGRGPGLPWGVPLSCDRDQPMRLPPDLRDWLSGDHLAWFVIDAVAELDLEPFYDAHHEGSSVAAERTSPSG